MPVTEPAMPFPINIFAEKPPVFQKIPVDKFVHKQLYIDFLLTSTH